MSTKKRLITSTNSTSLLNKKESIKRKVVKTSISSSSSNDLSTRVINELHKVSSHESKLWFENYVKGTIWIGCKVPIVRATITKIIKEEKTLNKIKSLPYDTILKESIKLLQCKESDVKLGGMIMIQEHISKDYYKSKNFLTKLLNDLIEHVLIPDHINDWSTTDWFSIRVLQPIVLSNCEEEEEEGDEQNVIDKILSFNEKGKTVWHRRCGLITFVNYYKHREKLPSDIGFKIIHNIDINMSKSPSERFTQTGCAWVLRYCLIQKGDQKEEKQMAMKVIMKYKDIWTNEAKKSFCEKLSKTDPFRQKILSK
mmetsp:Transcript_35203/g.45394  ORF Transcript_35203/g.45394 Transcript_35203/m.45394 type:complete len:312 (+) Transcript_35203:126-1061(+)